MKLLITGASGFLGQHVVAEALREGHHVVAAVRPAVNTTSLPWDGAPNLDYARIDLRSRNGLEEALEGIDAVVHLAAQMAGDIYAQYEGTVITTENLLRAMVSAGTRHIVLISSFSVYGYIKRPTGTLIDEDSPLEERIDERDDYAYTKTEQENLVRACANEHGWTCTILRPGVIYGRDKTFGARNGMKLGEKRWLALGSRAQLPLTYVANCAQATVKAASRPEAAGQTLNVVDNDPPTQKVYNRQLQRRTVPRPSLIPMPWNIARFIAALAWMTNKIIFRGQAKLPGLLIPARLHARFKPLRYSNKRIREVLDWTPRYTLEEALDICYSVGPDPDLTHIDREATQSGADT